MKKFGYFSESAFKQSENVLFICYQPNCLTLSKGFKKNAFHSRKTQVLEALMELVRNDSLFVASGPTYPYSFACERVHLDGVSQNVEICEILREKNIQLLFYRKLIICTIGVISLIYL